jgi:anthranilate synthase component 2/para-aminobenzoate synthetase component 2
LLGISADFIQRKWCDNTAKKNLSWISIKVKTLKTSALFKENKIFKVGRYHSLKLKEPFNSRETLVTMRCMETGVAMAFENTVSQVYGFQFHPESFLTQNGKYIIQKVLSA